MSEPTIDQVIEYYQNGQLQEAYQACKQLLATQSDNPTVLQLTGLICIELGYFQDAVTVLGHATTLEPENYEIWNILGMALEGFGVKQDAAMAFKKSLEYQPDFIDALLNLAVLLQSTHQLEEAKPYYERILQIEPNAPDILSNYGALLLELSDAEGAVQTLNKSIELNPNQNQAYFNLGMAYRHTNQLDKALSVYKKAIEHQPDFTEAYFQMGITYKLLGKHDEEERCYEKTIDIEPTHYHALMRLALIYDTQSQYEKAKAAYECLQMIAPDNPIWPLRLACVSPNIMPTEESIEAYQKHLSGTLHELSKDTKPFPMPINDLVQSYAVPPYHMIYQGYSNKEVKSLFAQYLAQRIPISEYSVKPKPLANRKIRVGFFCAENRENSFWVLQGGFIERLDASRFEIIIIGIEHTWGLLKEKLGHVSGIQFMPLPIDIHEAVQAMRDAELDVIHHFEVGSTPKNYMLALYRVAPVQCTSWGILETSGIPNMDYYLSSSFFESESHDVDSHYSETLVTLESAFAYLEPAKVPDRLYSRSELQLPEDKHIYGCPHSLFKLHPEFDTYVGAILEADPRGTVVFNEAGNPQLTQQFKERLKQNLPNVYDRITFLPFLGWQAYMSFLNTCDVLLDPLHFGGGITSCNAFTLGTPIVTQPSEYLKGRITTGLYKMMGITDAIVSSKAEYVQRCLEIAQNPNIRQALSKRILENNEELFQDDAMIEALENFFQYAVEKALS